MAEFVDPNARLLSLLLEQKTLSVSSVKSKASRDIFSTLEQTGVIQRKRKGAGNQYQLISQLNLVDFIKSRYPSGVYGIEAEDTPRRVQGIQESQNSKSLSKLDFSLITLRGTSSIKQDEKVYDLVQLTNENTFLSLKLTDKLHPEILQKNSTIITVENPTAFTELESMMQRPWDIAIYTGGKMANLLVQQLNNWACTGHAIVHFGDYDYVGLLEFTRVLLVCPKAELYVPAKFSSEMIQQYGNTLLLENQIDAHQTLLKKLEVLPKSQGKQQLTHVYKLLQENGKGLEQESCFSK